jgi:nitrite reductase/ring-hydroxylating ferredoxin subunit
MAGRRVTRVVFYCGTSRVTLVDVGSSDAFEEGVMQILQAERRQIGVIRWRGNIYALRNICPHQLGPVCEGRVLTKLTSDAVGTVSLDEGTLTLTCPWHGWEFYVDSGRALGDPQLAVKTYRTFAKDGRILVEVVG